MITSPRTSIVMSSVLIMLSGVLVALALALQPSTQPAEPRDHLGLTAGEFVAEYNQIAGPSINPLTVAGLPLTLTVMCPLLDEYQRPGAELRTATLALLVANSGRCTMPPQVTK